MNKIFRFDVRGAYIAVVALTPGFLMMSTALVGLDTNTQLISGVVLGTTVLLVIWMLLARGTFILFDHSSNTLRSSRFFFPRTIPFADITALKSKGTFGGAITELRVEYKNKKGEVRNSIVMAKQTFRDEEFPQFIEELRAACPNVAIARNLLPK